MEQRIAGMILILSVLAVAPGRASAQKPVVNPGGIVNAATFAPLGQPGYGVGHGSLAAVFGQNLASETASASGFPLPTTLAGTSVTFGGVPAPLIYVSPTQINLQVPVKAPFSTPQVVVTTSAGASDPQPVQFGVAPGVFTLDASGCGRGALFNVAQDGTLSLNGPENSAEPGGFLAVWGTGLASYAEPDLPDGILPLPLPPYAISRTRRWSISSATSTSEAVTRCSPGPLPASPAWTRSTFVCLTMLPKGVPSRWN